jgi:hypothetical protein
MIKVFPDTIRDIELTEQGKKEQKQAIFITDLDNAKIIEHPVRMAIIRILDRGITDTITTKHVDKATLASTITTTPTQRFALSVIEIVKVSKLHDDILTLTRNKVNHHLPKLVSKQYVHIYGTVTTGKRTTQYFRRAAKQYIVTMETPYYSKKWLEQRETARLERTLRAFDIKLTDDEKSELASLLTKSELLKDNWRAKIADLARGDVTEPNITDMYHWLIDAYAMGSQEYLDIHLRIREILFQE